MNRYAYYIGWYYLELRRRTDIQRSATIPITILAALAALIGFILVYLQEKGTFEAWTIEFWGFVTLVLFLVLASLFFVTASGLLLHSMRLHKRYWIFHMSDKYINLHLEAVTGRNEAVINAALRAIVKAINTNTKTNHQRETLVGKVYNNIGFAGLCLVGCFIVYLLELFLKLLGDAS